MSRLFLTYYGEITLRRLSSWAELPYIRRPGVATRSLPPSLVLRFAQDTVPARSVKAGLSGPSRGGEACA